jgi:PKD repeat protein
MKRAALASVMAALLTLAGAAPAHADFQPTPAPVRDLTQASPNPPATEVINPYTGSSCGGWYLENNYADSWPAATTWWEAGCTSVVPQCWPACEVDQPPDFLIDLYYWDGSQAVFYGERYYQDWLSGVGCVTWWDSATALWYLFDRPACPWTGPGNAAPWAESRISCTAFDCTFDATGSFASDGIASYLWDFGDGTTAGGPIEQHTYAELRRYPVTLTVTDTGGLAARESSSVRIDIPPIATFTYTCSGWTCNFDGTASSDPDGTVQKYSWCFGDSVSGCVPGGSTAQHTYTQAGSYNASLWVVDDAGIYVHSPEQTVVISGQNPNHPPIASLTVTCVALRCHFDPSASYDPDGTIVQYDWTFVDANNSGWGNGYYTPAPQDVKFPHDGTWVVTLTVTDNLTLKASTSQTVTLTDLPPTAAFASSCSGLTCTFDASASTDSDGTVQSYSWSFGDAASATTSTAQHTYASAGTYAVTLSVSDDAGLVDTTSKSITVVATVPTASFTVTCVGGSCTFDASASTDIGGTITTYSWMFGDGTTGQGKVVSHSYPSTGTYNATLTVTDSGGVTTSTSKTASSIKLTATVAKVKNLRQVSLSWAGSNATAFDVYRDGVWIVTVVATSYTEAFSKPGTYTYKVCEANKSICSNSVTVSV